MSKIQKIDETVTCEDVLSSAWNPELRESKIGVPEYWEHVIPKTFVLEFNHTVMTSQHYAHTIAV